MREIQNHRTFPRLLPHKLITGKAQYNQSISLVLLMQFHQLLIVSPCQTAPTRHVYYEQHLALVLTQLLGAAVHVFDAYFVEGGVGSGAVVLLAAATTAHIVFANRGRRWRGKQHMVCCFQSVGKGKGSDKWG